MFLSVLQCHSFQNTILSQKRKNMLNHRLSSFYRPAEVGTPLSQVDTPCLIIDLNSFENNLKKLHESLRTSGLSDVKVRPHSKSHKCPTIALQQVALGAVGVCCQKVSEAEAMVAGGVKDVLISNEVVGASKLKKVARLAKNAKVTICVDHPVNVLDLDAAASEENAIIHVLVEINVGANRCGIEPGEPAVELAKLVQKCRNLRFDGIQGYHGLAQHIRNFEDRGSAILGACDKVRHTLQKLSQEGIPCSVVTGAGTGTFMFEAASKLYTEIQPGSYLFMDADYSKNNWFPWNFSEGSEASLQHPVFEQSLFIWTSVMSCPTKDRAIVDAGHKAASIDSGLPLVYKMPSDVVYTEPSDEHGILKLNGTTFLLGEKLMLIPSHCDPTVNLYDHFVCIRDGYVEALWPITARGSLL